MGLEAVCVARHKSQVSQGRALLEASELIFRGDFRLVIPLGDIKASEAKRGDLVVRFSGGTATFALGKQAEKWAFKIRYPKSRLDKLGVKPDSVVSVLHLRDEEFLDELRSRASAVSSGRRRARSGIIFLGAEDRAGLRRLASLVDSIARDGCVWLVYPKGVTSIRESEVMAAGKGAGLVDVKNMSFSDTHSALKFVIPVANR